MGIGVGVIGMNPTNMGSTMTLLKDVPDLKYELRGICAKRAEVLEPYAKQIGIGFWTTDYRELVIRYMRHFQQCLEGDLQPTPDVVEGAKSVAVGVAAWESIRKGGPVNVFNDF